MLKNSRREALKLNKKVATSSLLAIIFGSMGIAGALGWCCTVIGAAILSFLGLAALSGFLAYYSKWLLLSSLAFAALAIFFYYRYGNKKSCGVKNENVKKN